MRGAFLTDILRSVRGSLGRFLAIMGIVALGCGFYAGLQMSGPDMRADADALYDGTNLWDVRLISTLGFGDDDVERVRAVEGVREVMPSLTADAMARLGTEQVAVRITSIDVDVMARVREEGLYVVASDDRDNLNRPRLVEGRWPRAEGECVVSADVPRADYGIGDEIELLYGASDLDELLGVTRLAIVGTVTSSNYPYTGSFGSTTLGSGMIDQYLFVSNASLAEDAPYTEIYLTVEGAAAELSESKAYQEVVDATKGRLEGLSATLAAARQADLKAEAQEKLDEKWAEYDDEKAKADKELADARAELDDAADKIADGERELADGEQQYRDGVAEYERQKADAYKKLDDAAAQIERSQKELERGRKQLASGEKDYQKGRAEYRKGLRKLLRETGTKSLAAADKKLQGGARQAQEGIAQLEEGIAQIEAAPAQAKEGIAQAKAAIKQATEGRTKAEAGIAEAEAGIAEADAALAQLAPLKEQLDGQKAVLEQQIGQLEQDLSQATDEEKPALEAQLSGLEQSLEQLSGQLAEIEGRIAQAEAGKRQAEAGKAEAEAGKRAAEEGLTQAQAGLAQAEAGLEQANEAQKKLPALRKQLAGVRKTARELTGALQGVDELRLAKTKLDEAKKTLADSRAKLSEGERQLEQGRRELASGRAEAERELANAQAQLDDAAAELASGRAELDDARTKYADGLKEYEDGKAEADEKFGDALAQLTDAQEEIDGIKRPDIYALDRTQSEGAATYHADAGRIDAIADVFPFIFFLVAALVALTTMTRMVEDDRVLIGTYKALGYGTAAIAAKYLAYAGIAGVVGAFVGIAILSQVLPYIVMRAYSIIYTVPIHAFPLPVNAGIALMSGGLGVGVTLAATWGAVVSSLREAPATLMLPRAPKAGKRILLERVRPVWQHLSFTWKVTCRNLFRYKRRFLMTVIGISGCTALLLVGFGLHDAIWDIIDRQYGPIIHFDTTIGLDDDAIELDVRRVCDYLDSTGEVEGIVRVQNENMQAGAADSDETIRVNVVIPRDVDDMARAITFRNRLSGTPLDLDDDAVLVTEKLAMKYGLDVGDTILLFDQDDVGNAVGEGHALAITGVAENYVGNFVYVGRGAWRSVSKRTPVFSTIYASTTADEAVRGRITDELHDMEDVSTVIFSDETINMYRKMLSVVDMIVVVLIVSAAALAYIVLYNLTNINIGERVREIASLKVLGFTRGEVYSYIFREILLLAVIGDAVGVWLGIVLERFVVTTAEVDYVMFGRSIHLPSFGYAFALTLVFTVLVIVSMRRKLDRVDMVESLKSVD